MRNREWVLLIAAGTLFSLTIYKYWQPTKAGVSGEYVYLRQLPSYGMPYATYKPIRDIFSISNHGEAVSERLPRDKSNNEKPNNPIVTFNPIAPESDPAEHGDVGQIVKEKVPVAFIATLKRDSGWSAYLDVGGVGTVVTEGQEIKDYFVVSISSHLVVLREKESGQQIELR